LLGEEEGLQVVKNIIGALVVIFVALKQIEPVVTPEEIANWLKGVLLELCHH